MKTIPDEEYLQKALHTDKDASMRGQVMIPETGLPPYPIMRLIAYDDYPRITDPKMCSVTQIIDSFKIQWFYRHKPELAVLDITQSSGSLIGNALHSYAEKANTYFGGEVEVEWRAKVGEFTLRGIADLYQDGLITDYKNGMISQIIDYGDINKSTDKKDYILQGKILMWLARQNDVPAQRFYVASIGRDHTGAMKHRGINQFWSPIWERHMYEYDPTIEEYIKKRVSSFMQVMDIQNEEEVPLCSNEDRWYRGESYGVYKTLKNGKPAQKCIRYGRIKREDYPKQDIQAMAKAKAVVESTNTKTNHIVIHQKGENIRCDSWCPFRFSCKQNRGEE